MAEKNISKGKVVTESDIEALANEAEAGYDDAVLKKRVGRPAMGSAAADVFPVRLDPELRAAIEERARNDIGLIKKDETFFMILDEEQ